ncbi:MAG TPA: carboxypeptidase-like regulatory domain-containing protein [Gemmatimonadaceae bacterium]|jgi:hypothetical protein
MIAFTARAQAGWIAGIVLRDSSGHVLQGARIDLLKARLSATTNAMGEFRVNDVPVGRQPLLIRHAGFAPRTDTITIESGVRAGLEYIMIANPLVLDSVEVTEAAAPHSPGLREFDERRKFAGGGTFITRDIFRKNDQRSVMDILSSYVPGIRPYQPDPKFNPNAWYVSSTHKCGDGPVILSCNAAHPECPLTLYVDGIPMYIPASGHPGGESMRVPDLSHYSPQELDAAEVYLGGAAMPPKYNVTGNGCGVLLLWSRDR